MGKNKNILGQLFITLMTISQLTYFLEILFEILLLSFNRL